MNSSKKSEYQQSLWHECRQLKNEVEWTETAIKRRDFKTALETIPVLQTRLTAIKRILRMLGVNTTWLGNYYRIKD